MNTSELYGLIVIAIIVVGIMFFAGSFLGETTGRFRNKQRKRLHEQDQLISTLLKTAYRYRGLAEDEGGISQIFIDEIERYKLKDE